jgi:uncharacterized protein YkwD
VKISSKKIGIIIVFVSLILFEGISIAESQTAILGEKAQKEMLSIESIVEQEEVEISDEEKETLNLINEYRKENGLKELKIYSKLQEVAKLKAEDIVNNQYFSHTSPNLGTPFEMLENNNVNYKIAGENLAGNISPSKAVDAWINSKKHRENILEDDFEYTGIYVIDSPVYGKVFVQLFIGIK